MLTGQKAFYRMHIVQSLLLILLGVSFIDATRLKGRKSAYTNSVASTSHRHRTLKKKDSRFYHDVYGYSPQGFNNICKEYLRDVAIDGGLTNLDYAEFIYEYCEESDYRGPSCQKASKHASFQSLSVDMQLNFVGSRCPEPNVVAALECLQFLNDSMLEFNYREEISELCVSSYSLMLASGLVGTELALDVEDDEDDIENPKLKKTKHSNDDAEIPSPAPTTQSGDNTTKRTDATISNSKNDTASSKDEPTSKGIFPEPDLDVEVTNTTEESDTEIAVSVQKEKENEDQAVATTVEEIELTSAPSKSPQKEAVATLIDVSAESTFVATKKDEQVVTSTKLDEETKTTVDEDSDEPKTDTQTVGTLFPESDAIESSEDIANLPDDEFTSAVEPVEDDYGDEESIVEPVKVKPSSEKGSTIDTPVDNQLTEISSATPTASPADEEMIVSVDDYDEFNWAEEPASDADPSALRGKSAGAEAPESSLFQPPAFNEDVASLSSERKESRLQSASTVIFAVSSVVAVFGFLAFALAMKVRQKRKNTTFARAYKPFDPMLDGGESILSENSLFLDLKSTVSGERSMSNAEQSWTYENSYENRSVMMNTLQRMDSADTDAAVSRPKKPSTRYNPEQNSVCEKYSTGSLYSQGEKTVPATNKSMNMQPTDLSDTVSENKQSDGSSVASLISQFVMREKNNGQQSPYSGREAPYNTISTRAIDEAADCFSDGEISNLTDHALEGDSKEGSSSNTTYNTSVSALKRMFQSKERSVNANDHHSDTMSSKRDSVTSDSESNSSQTPTKEPPTKPVRHDLASALQAQRLKIISADWGSDSKSTRQEARPIVYHDSKSALMSELSSVLKSRSESQSINTSKPAVSESKSNSDVTKELELLRIVGKKNSRPSKDARIEELHQLFSKVAAAREKDALAK